MVLILPEQVKLVCWEEIAVMWQEVVDLKIKEERERIRSCESDL